MGYMAISFRITSCSYEQFRLALRLLDQTETAKGKKPTENPAEPEAHGTRVRWQDLPKNILIDEKAILTSPLHAKTRNGGCSLAAQPQP
jgi:hypothetical protein